MRETVTLRVRYGEMSGSDPANIDLVERKVRNRMAFERIDGIFSPHQVTAINRFFKKAHLLKTGRYTVGLAPAVGAVPRSYTGYIRTMRDLVEFYDAYSVFDLSITGRQVFIPIFDELFGDAWMSWRRKR
jgi:hypothetical protein